MRKEIDALPQIMNTAQVARLCAKSERSIRRLAKSGALPHGKIGREYRFDRDKILKALGVV